ncbi:DUF1772 domain-containing protein [Sphingomonas sp.]|uniref:DUF1772 domain-containing protein n=1 Tax=Sphingomonas sp. TaxID=28214 RepID=UPI001B2B8A9A|nr:DUF1772 domain-containing protein [Sphingomonas sp.]MBO9715060.1 DUF1772 domain-containing protein [Sphingomonas sp.]
MLALLGLITAALFTGASLYVSWAEHPARMKLDDRAALAQWKPSYDRAAMLQASLALASAAAGIAAWARWRSMWPWLGGGVLMLSVIVYTFAVIWKTNQRLEATAPDAAGPETRALLVRWGQLHLVRTLLGLLATLSFAVGLLPA